jgi:D-glucosaminate-6-phosphate ammonia-lyase
MPDVFAKFGVKPVINACGIYTDLGGARLSRTVWDAMQEINRHFVRMPDLLDQSGAMIAALLGAEAARVTPGAAAAIALGTCACVAGMDGGAWERLPDTTGLKSEVIIQRGHRYKYDRQVSMTGARLVEVDGDQIAAAIGPRTGAILFPAHRDGQRGTVPLADVIALARRRGVPTLIDAAYLNHPTEIMRRHTAMGADLVCYSAKYFLGPNSGGFIMGRKDLIAAVAGVDFTRYESGKYLTYGRPFKLDRHTIVGTVVALEEWLAMDHEARWKSFARRADELARLLQDVPGLRLEPMHFTMEEQLEKGPVNCLTIRADNVRRIAERLADGMPSIATLVPDDALIVAMDTIADEEVAVIGDSIRQAARQP